MRIQTNKIVSVGVRGLEVRYGVIIEGVPFDEMDSEKFGRFLDIIGRTETEMEDFNGNHARNY